MDAATELVQRYSLRNSAEAEIILRKDKKRLHQVASLLKQHTAEELLGIFLPFLIKKSPVRFRNAVQYVHTALLMVSSPSLIMDWLREEKFDKELRIFPSVVVKERLLKRYAKEISSPEDIPVTIIKTKIASKDYQNDFTEIEIFIPTPKNGVLSKKFIDEETTKEYEFHHAFKLQNKNALPYFYRVFIEEGYKIDGYGYNMHENVTTMYFLKEHGIKNIRIECFCIGNSVPLFKSLCQKSLD